MTLAVDIAAELLEGAGEIDPVEAEDDVGVADRVGRLGRQHDAAGRAGMQRMIGRERGADLEIGDHARAEALGQRDARVPGVEIARDAAGEDHRMLGVAQQVGGLRDGVRRRRALDLRHEALGVDRRRAARRALSSCISASRLT